MKEPLVSIIISTYNEEKYVVDSINSILMQDYNNIEIIVVDDASTDNTVSEIRALDNEKIQLYINTTNKKLAHNLNFAISKASGKYIARMDADDLSRKNRIRKQVEYMEKHQEIDILTTYAKTFGDSSIIKKTSSRHEVIFATLLFTNPICHPTVMFRKHTLDYQYDEKCAAGQDYELWTRIIDKKRFGTIPKVLLDYRVIERQRRKEYLQIQKQNGLLARKHIFDKLFCEANDTSWALFSELVDVDFYDFKPKTQKQMIELVQFAKLLILKNREKHILSERCLLNAISDVLFKQWYCSILKTDVKAGVLLKSPFKRGILQQNLFTILKSLYKICIVFLHNNA